MFRFPPPVESLSLDLPHGVRLRVRPLTTMMMVAVQDEAARAAQRIAEHHAEMRAWAPRSATCRTCPTTPSEPPSSRRA